MTEKNGLSREALLRLPVYFRYLRKWMIEGRKKVSSEDFASVMEVTASQVRRDMSCLGMTGQKGYGYPCAALHDILALKLGVLGEKTAVIIGAGHLGTALANHRIFRGRGYRVGGIFDIDPSVAGQVINGVKVMPMDALARFCLKEMPQVAVLAVPDQAAAEAAEKISELGIPGILNFSYTDLPPMGETVVENVHFSDSLMVLSYRIKENGSSPYNLEQEKADP